MTYSVQAIISCVWQSAAGQAHLSYLVLVVVIIAQSLAVLVQLAHQHLSCAEIKGAEVHLVSKVTGQLRLAPKLLPRWTDKGGRDTRNRYINISSSPTKTTDIKTKQRHFTHFKNTHTHTERTENYKQGAQHATSQQQTEAEHIQVSNGTKIT